MAIHHRFIAVSAVLVLLSASLVQSSPARADDETPEEYVVEFYYKVKWGHFGEFFDLYRKNHYPILKRLQDLGRITRMEAVFPMNHAGEANRWDMRFTIVYLDVVTAHEDFDTSTIIAELYPDKATFEIEEQRRFELLIEHMDIPVQVNDLSEWGSD